MLLNPSVLPFVHAHVYCYIAPIQMFASMVAKNEAKQKLKNTSLFNPLLLSLLIYPGYVTYMSGHTTTTYRLKYWERIRRVEIIRLLFVSRSSLFFSRLLYQSIYCSTFYELYFAIFVATAVAAKYVCST